MKKVYYEKRGRKYVPVAEYDSEWLDSYPAGTHLVMCYPGGKSRRFNIDPDYAAMIAAGRVAEDAISSAIVKASDLRPRRTPVTPEQREAWEKLSAAFGEEIHVLEWPSAREAAEAAVKAMMQEAKNMLDVPAVRAAYEHFVMTYQLCKDHEANK